MLDSIYQLGLVQKVDNLPSLLTPVSARHVIGIIFENKDGNKIKYEKSQLDEFLSPLSYLYRRDFSGRPGLFLTGNISPQDIDRIKKILSDSRNINSPEVQKFIRDKILWFARGKLVNNHHLLNTLNDYRRNELSGIFEELERNGQKIARDVIGILTKDEPERTLVTIMIHNTQDKSPKFIGQIQDYKEFFKKGILSKKYEVTEKLTCSTCNRKELIGTFIEKPLPFYVADKPMFFPDADPNAGKKRISDL